MTPFPELSTQVSPDWPYLELRAALLARDGVQDAYALRLSDLTEWWACSVKTAKRHLARLQTEEKLSYAPGRGRGNTSRVSFSGDVQAELAALTAALADQGAAGDLARLSRLPFPRAWVLSDAVRGVFGLSASPGGVDRLRTVLMRDLTSLDPLTVHASTEAHLLLQVLDALVLFDPDAREVRPHLAHHWDVSVDGLTWTFHLRKGVAFHHGRTLDAGDVVFTFRRVLDGAAWALPNVQDVREVGPFTVAFHLRRPDAFLPRRLAEVQCLILPRDVPFDERRPVGTGAFRWMPLDGGDREGGLRLSAFDAHFAGRPLIDEVELYRVDPLSTLPYLHVQGAEAEIVDDVQPENGVQFALWNSARPAAGNAALRAAVAELNDIHAFMAACMTQEGMVPASSFYSRRSLLSPPPPRCEARAAERLREAAYGGPPLVVWALDRPDALAQAHWLAARAARHGLEMLVEKYELTYTPWPGDAVDIVLLGEVSGMDEHLSFSHAMTQPELLFRRLLPPDVLARVDSELEGYRTPRTFTELEGILDRVEALLLGGHHLMLTHHRVKRRAIHPLLRDVLPDGYGRINFRKLWIGERTTPPVRG